MAVIEPVRIDGMKEFVRGLKQMDAGLPKAVRLALNDAVNVVLDYVRPRIPKRSGRAQRSIQARSTRTQARVAAGGKRAPYFPWLDFGGEGRRPGRPAARPFIKQGRYIYAGLAAKRTEFTETMESRLVQIARGAGIEVD